MPCMALKVRVRTPPAQVAPVRVRFPPVRSGAVGEIHSHENSTRASRRGKLVWGNLYMYGKNQGGLVPEEWCMVYGSRSAQYLGNRYPKYPKKHQGILNRETHRGNPLKGNPVLGERGLYLFQNYQDPIHRR